MAPAKKVKTAKAPAPEENPAPKVDNARQLNIVLRKDASEARVCAEMALGPLVGSASTALDYSKALMGDLVLQDCIDVVAGEIKAVNSGDLNNLEGLLTSQALALDAMFNNFAKRALHASYLPQMDTFTRLAMKAQAQCRTTVEAIAEIKFPKSATFIKQANIAQQQQVNNGAANDATNGQPAALAQEKTINPTNELLLETAHAPLDAGGAGTTSRLDTQLEAVGAHHRAAH